MNTSQRIILIILTVFGVTTEVNAVRTGGSGNNTYTLSADISQLIKEGTGTTTLHNPSIENNIEEIEITAGTLKVDETVDLGGAQVIFNSAGGGTLEVAGNINTGEMRLNTAGTLKVNAGYTAVLSADTTTIDDFTLTKIGDGILFVSVDRSASETPMAVSAGTLKVGESGKLPNDVITISGTGTLLLDASVADTAPGATNINSGGTLKTSAAVPAGTNIFSGGLTFRSGAILDLGGDWGQNITVAP